MRKRRPPRETKTVGGKAPKAPEAADAGQYAITGEEKSTAKSEKNRPWAAEIGPPRAGGTLCPAEATVPP